MLFLLHNTPPLWSKKPSKTVSLCMQTILHLFPLWPHLSFEVMGQIDSRENFQLFPLNTILNLLRFGSLSSNILFFRTWFKWGKLAYDFSVINQTWWPDKMVLANFYQSLFLSIKTKSVWLTLHYRRKSIKHVYIFMPNKSLL